MERRFQDRLTDMWSKLAESHKPPLYSALNHAIMQDSWTKCVMLELEPGATRERSPSYKLTHIGAGVKSLFADYRANQKCKRLSLEPHLRKMFQHIDDIARTGEMVKNNGTTLLVQSQKTIKFRTCLMPFADKDGNICCIIIGISYLES